MKFIAAISACAIVAVSALGCGSSNENSSSSQSKLGEPALQGPEPSIDVPHGPPPKSLVVEAIRAGEGASVRNGDTVAIQYVGGGFKTGKPFDSAWEHDAPYRFEVGAGHVLPGWEMGVLGMKVGERRQVIVPPDLTEEELGAHETLIYVIDLLAVERQSDPSLD